MKPLISCIVPVYNVESFISQCVESLTAQTYPNFEIILIDDGSPDNCPAICDKFEKHHDNIRVIHQQNKGISGTRNTGIDAANGELITFVDSDDSVHPELLERLYQLMEESGADISSVSACKGKTAAGRLTSWQAIKCLLKENTTLNTSAWGKLLILMMMCLTRRGWVPIRGLLTHTATSAWTDTVGRREIRMIIMR